MSVHLLFCAPCCYFFSCCIRIHRNVIHVVLCARSFRIHNWNAWPKMRKYAHFCCNTCLAGVHFATKQASYFRLMSLSTSLVDGIFGIVKLKIKMKGAVRMRWVWMRTLAKSLLLLLFPLQRSFSLHFFNAALLLLLHLFVFNNLFLFYMEIKMV